MLMRIKDGEGTLRKPKMEKKVGKQSTSWSFWFVCLKVTLSNYKRSQNTKLKGKHQ